MSAALLAQLAAPALIVAWSPFKVVPALILVFNAPRPRATGLAFFIGSVVGQLGVTALFIRAPHLVDRVETTPTPAVGWIEIALAVLTLLAAGLSWSRRDKVIRAPAWLIRLTRVTPPAAAILGAVLVVTNLKVMAANAAAGFLIGSAALGIAALVAVLVLYTAVATSTIAIPVAGYLVAPSLVDRWLTAAKAHLYRHQVIATTVGLIVIGVALLLVGIGTVVDRS
ncbi:GAP family protein [Mycolicibacterium bacteremicum]|uniref:GAP family protein n=1 Tax=Mycolicibacterium bacteremicum TaxID=564198 RepID=UPI0026F1F87A|nr:GAP family protein [Mycolicibacterium bacteremicum]